MEQTKGYLTLKGKIWGLNNKQPYENDSIRSLSFGIQTRPDNSLFLQVGKWKNTVLNIKLKAEGMEEVLEVNEQAGIDQILEHFKDGDYVFINVRTEINPYRNSIDYLVNQIYIDNKTVDFDDPNFVETNELNQTVIITEKPSDRRVKVGLTTYRGEMIEQELRLSDNDVNVYFLENVDVGDIMRLSLSVNRTPHYADDDGKEEVRTTLKGKTIKSGGSRKADGYEEFLEVTDVDLEKIEKKKYDRQEIRSAQELATNQSTTKSTSTLKSNTITKDNVEENKYDDDLPF